ncbi:hypothetical protein AAEO50_04105 [Rossellomorea oryzaecorticis]|uniref:NADH dehydrogenase subunit 4L n=1 Tax=Rossellomorea oryzaecorticis TaxID=1396505 RepID=A0ABU9K5X6_9BACI
MTITMMMLHAATVAMMVFFLASALTVFFLASAFIRMVMMVVSSVAFAGMRIVDLKTFLFNGFISSGVSTVIMVIVVIIV